MLSIFYLLLLTFRGTLAYNPVREYSGLSFFDGWDFYGSWDNLTLGDVWWLDRDDAYKTNLAYINAAGNAILKVDDTSTVATGQKRNSVSAARFACPPHSPAPPGPDNLTRHLLRRLAHPYRPRPPALRLLRLARVLDDRPHVAGRRRDRRH